MQRLPEPELMTILQVEAYADADFAAGDDHTLALIESLLASDLRRWPQWGRLSALLISVAALETSPCGWPSVSQRPA